MYQEPIWYTIPILLEADSILWRDNKKFLVDLAGSQRLASQSYLGKEGTHNTTYLILCYNACEKYITPMATSESLNIVLWPWEPCSQKDFSFHMHTQKYFQFVMTLLCTKILIPRRLLLSTQKRYLLVARRSAGNVYRPQKHSFPEGVHQHVRNSLHSFWNTMGKSFKIRSSCQSPCKLAPTYQFDQLFQSHTSCPC